MNEIRLLDILKKTEEKDFSPLDNGITRFVKVAHMDKDQLYLKRWGDIKKDLFPPTFYKVFRKGQILFPTRNPHLRRVIIAPFKGICGEKTLTLSILDEKVIPELIPFIFQSNLFIEHCTDAIIGSTNPHVRWRDVAEFKFKFPSLDDQRKLADLLMSVEDNLLKSENFLSIAKKLRRGMINKFTYVGFKNSVLKNTEVGKVCGEWPVFKLKDIVTLQRGISYRSKNLSQSKDDNYLINLKSFCKNGGINYDGFKLFKGEFNEKFTTQPGDLIIANTDITPGADIIGYPAFVPRYDTKKEILFTMDVSKVEVISELIRKEFIYWYLLSDVVHDYMKSYSSGTTVLHLSASKVLDLLVPVPPVKEQDKIIAILDEIESTISSFQVNIERLFNLKKTLMDDILNGKVKI